MYYYYNKDLDGELDIVNMNYSKNRGKINEYCAQKLIQLGYDIDENWISINRKKIVEHGDFFMCYEFYEMFVSIYDKLKNSKKIMWIDGYNVEDGYVVVDDVKYSSWDF